MTEVYTHYEHGLQTLLERLGKEHYRYTEALTLQARLLENIALTQQYGDTETRRAERAQILDGLNALSIAVLQVSFNDVVALRNAAILQADKSAGSAEDVFPTMILIPSGQFVMGSGSYDPWSLDNERPQHTCTTESYSIGKHPITNTQYRAFVEATGYRAPENWNVELNPRVPVTYVSWNDCLEYCRWLKKVTGRDFHLPTEAEWERAARGKDGYRWPWGNEFDEIRCNIASNLSNGGITAVGKFSPFGNSPCDISDMAGNVWEWTSSLLMSYPYTYDERENIDTPGERVLRGGSWRGSKKSVRCTCRKGAAPGLRRDDIGFRVAYSEKDRGNHESPSD